MPLFGPLHLTILAIVALMAAGFVTLCRRSDRTLRASRWVIGSALTVNELIWWVYRYSREGVRSGNLPFQLCDVAVWLAVVACFVAAPAIRAPAYFLGLAGPGMALLTPDLFVPWPQYPTVYFFLAHGGIVIAVMVIVFGGHLKLGSWTVWWSFGLLLLYAAFVGLLDRKLGANYMFLVRKPDAASALDRMGPWPWYLLNAAGVALAMFWLLWLPVARRGAPASQISAASPSCPAANK